MARNVAGRKSGHVALCICQPLSNSDWHNSDAVRHQLAYSPPL
jgi:hypothetical protein